MTKAPPDPSSRPLAVGTPPDERMFSSDPVDAAQHPRLVEEHHVLGPYGEDEIEATDETGRRWYHLRPEQRSRYDLIGFNWTWWLIMWMVLLFIILPVGGAWHY